MNTIPTIFNETFPSYTVMGGRELLASTGLAAVLLNRRGRYGRRNLFYDLESSPEHYDVEELAERFPFVRFVLPRDKLSIGEQINLAASELDSPLFFVLWNDLKMIAGGRRGEWRNGSALIVLTVQRDMTRWEAPLNGFAPFP